ncbi:hypothetical protein GF382_00415 [Candidatus Falkowbacteria bacterium]|nr:hypothetical protein [Candidatus Falkowbacteria bacterium]
MDYIDTAWVDGDNIKVSIKYSIAYAPEDSDGNPDPNLIKNPQVVTWPDGKEQTRPMTQPNAVDGYLGDVIPLPEGALTRFSLVMDEPANIWIYPSMAEKSKMWHSVSALALRPKVVSGVIIVLNKDNDTLYRSDGEVVEPPVEDTLPPGEVGDSISMVEVDDSIHIYYSTDQDSLRIRIKEASVIVATKKAEAVNGWAEFVFAPEQGDDPLYILLDDEERMKRCRWWSENDGALKYQFIFSGFQKRRVPIYP